MIGGVDIHYQISISDISIIFGECAPLIPKHFLHSFLLIRCQMVKFDFRELFCIFNIVVINLVISGCSSAIIIQSDTFFAVILTCCYPHLCSSAIIIQSDTFFAVILTCWLLKLLELSFCRNNRVYLLKISQMCPRRYHNIL